MIFATAFAEPAVFLMLSEADVESMRAGRTLFVDDRATQGATFSKPLPDGAELSLPEYIYTGCRLTIEMGEPACLTIAAIDRDKHALLQRLGKTSE